MEFDNWSEESIRFIKPKLKPIISSVEISKSPNLIHKKINSYSNRKEQQQQQQQQQQPLNLLATKARRNLQRKNNHLTPELVTDQNLLRLFKEAANWSQKAECLTIEDRFATGIYAKGIINPNVVNKSQIIVYIKGTPPEMNYDEWSNRISDMMKFAGVPKSFSNVMIDKVLAVLVALVYGKKYDCIPTVITFGSPRIGNNFFTEFVKGKLKAYRITYGDDYVPGFPKRTYLHHPTEYWIPLQNCDCVNEIQVYKCLPSEVKVFSFIHVDKIYEENQNCNAQFHGKKPETDNHHGPYFGFMMGEKCGRE
ncbi:hypothetical protein G9A89_000309 [Geosiphon pyriformis]|nr:hypothetical protein G9A89_000309 [Geosiphon pyriformis]